MKKIILLVFLVCVLAGSAYATCTGFTGGGSGTAGDPYEIDTCAELQSLDANTDCLDDYYELIGDVDCDVAPYNAGSGFDPIGDISNKFLGVFDGNGYLISDLTINRPTESYVALFAYVSGADARVEKVGLIDPIISGDVQVAPVAGRVGGGAIIIDTFSDGGIVTASSNAGGHTAYIATSGTVENSYSTGGSVTIINNRAGGFAGQVRGMLTNSWASNSVSGATQKGNFIGFVFNGIVTGSYTNDMPSNPDDSVGDGPSTGITEISNNLAYFQGDVCPANEPMASWDFDTVWDEVVSPDDYPVFGDQIEECALGPEPPVPEFTTIGVILTLVVVGLGTALVLRRKK